MKKIKRAIIVLPTYNEKDNIIPILNAIQEQKNKLERVELFVLVVDDSSPDGTGVLVKKFQKDNANIYLITGKKEGLGNAYKRGFVYAMDDLLADIVLEMDADFSHDPTMIPFLIKGVLSGYNFVIGSRYVPGGSIPEDWSIIRKLNSKVGNIFARYVAGLGKVKDCTGGFRAIDVSLLREMDFDDLNAQGYSFQINLLSLAMKNDAKILEIPIQFRDRTLGESKISSKDIFEFILNSFQLRFSNLTDILRSALLVTFIALFIMIVYGSHHVLHYSLLSFGVDLLVFTSLLMGMQGLFTIFLMLYAWEDAERIDKNRTPDSFDIPKFSFTALIPARHEASVIEQTIIAISQIDYPELLKEVLILCRYDDLETIEQAQKTIRELGRDSIKLVIFNDFPINKPHSLNIGLAQATKDVIVVFDAEDQPHRGIYNVINTVMQQKSSDVVQSGVQLMNYRSTWFSTLNVLEYFFWFKSILHFFAQRRSIPLGGNSVFIKRNWLLALGGWDEECLTEDADLGIRMSASGAKIDIVYDEAYATQEETPDTIKSFIKQRTRWNQGFAQILIKADWKKLRTFSQKIIILYILALPFTQPLLFILTPLSIYIALTVKLSVFLTILMLIPLQLLLLQVIIYNIGLYEFTKAYKLPYNLLMPIKVLLTFYPFQLVLALSAARAIIRLVFGRTSWEKTHHTNAHRELFIMPNVLYNK